MMRYNSELYKQYQKACEEYLHAFCEKHGFDYDDTCWVNNDVGTIAFVGDYCLSMETIIVDIEENAPKNKFIEYFDFKFDSSHNYNYRTWLRMTPKT